MVRERESWKILERITHKPELSRSPEKGLYRFAQFASGKPASLSFGASFFVAIRFVFARETRKNRQFAVASRSLRSCRRSQLGFPIHLHIHRISLQQLHKFALSSSAEVSRSGSQSSVNPFSTRKSSVLCLWCVILNCVIVMDVLR